MLLQAGWFANEKVEALFRDEGAQFAPSLRRMFVERHTQERAFVPARVMNLVVVVDAEFRGEIQNRLERVGRFHPSRELQPAGGWTEAVAKVGAPGLHFHDLRHTGNMLAANAGASTRDLMARMGHDSMRAALIYQHATR